MNIEITNKCLFCGSSGWMSAFATKYIVDEKSILNSDKKDQLEIDICSKCNHTNDNYIIYNNTTTRDSLTPNEHSHITCSYPRWSSIYIKTDKDTIELDMCDNCNCVDDSISLLRIVK